MIITDDTMLIYTEAGDIVRLYQGILSAGRPDFMVMEPLSSSYFCHEMNQFPSYYNQRF